MNKFRILSILLIFFSITGHCQKQVSEIKKGEVLEVIQVNSYTYLRIAENDVEKWLATPAIIAKVGEIYFYKGGLEMPSFKSSELNRTFNSVLFLQKVSKDKADFEAKSFQHKVSSLEKERPKESNGKLNLNIDSVEGGISISELFKNKDFYNNKVIKIKGQVTKFNSQVMSRNWVHLQDGTNFNEQFDLTLTTDDEVEVGDIVVFEGKVSLERDFGYGYFYKVIIEGSKLVSEE